MENKTQDQLDIANKTKTRILELEKQVEDQKKQMLSFPPINRENSDEKKAL